MGSWFVARVSNRTESTHSQKRLIAVAYSFTIILKITLLHPTKFSPKFFRLKGTVLCQLLKEAYMNYVSSTCKTRGRVTTCVVFNSTRNMRLS